MAQTNDKVVAINGAAPASLTIEKTRERLAPFIDANPVSSIIDGEKGPSVKSPWGDDTMAIDIPEDSDDLIAALNAVYLPERLTAIFHKDLQSIEVIFTAFPLGDERDDLYGRAFQFHHRERDHACEYGAASDRLLALAKNFRPVSAPSSTFFRNLNSYQIAMRFPAGEGGKQTINFKPVSFWIRGITWDEESVLDLISHLNFYMRYYDAFSPMVATHLTPSENINHQPIERFGYGPFPKAVESKLIDETLLHFWHASTLGSDPVRRFVYSYQILEYCAFNFIEDKIRKSIRKTLAAPNATADVNQLTERVIALVGESKIGEPAKFINLIKAYVDSSLIWREIKRNLAQFTKKTIFDGGFVLDEFLKDNSTFEEFDKNFASNFCDSLRNIRNALSHAKEQKSQAVITPTVRNFQRLQPWVTLVALAAQEVMVYRNLG